LGTLLWVGARPVASLISPKGSSLAPVATVITREDGQEQGAAGLEDSDQAEKTVDPLIGLPYTQEPINPLTRPGAVLPLNIEKPKAAEAQPPGKPRHETEQRSQIDAGEKAPRGPRILALLFSGRWWCSLASLRW
jgi:hypothetical protein